jgi:hypothetical protein
MEEKKRTAVSKCCETKVHVIPGIASMGEPTTYYCSKCLKECDLKIEKKNEHTR